jgi:two-component system LytT family response regulator
MLRTILVDDESHCLDTLQWQLQEYCPEVEVIAQCNSPLDAIEQIGKLKPQLVMLDIEMPKMNAFEMLKQLEPVEFDVIFTTAYDQFAVNAFKVSALDYLLKPVDEEELKRAIAKAVQRNAAPSHDQLSLLHERVKQPRKPLEKLALPTSEGLEFVSVKGIIYCESDSNYCHIIMDGDKQLFITRTLKEIQEALEGSNFFRIHNSYLANLDHVTRYVRGDGGYVVMSNGKSLSVARSKKDELMSVIGRV